MYKFIKEFASDKKVFNKRIKARNVVFFIAKKKLGYIISIKAVYQK